MKSYLDIEDLFPKIHSSKTRELVNEVFECYKVGSYRPALVMLWTVVISDLLFKIEEIAEIYEEPKAQKILEEIKKKWKSSPTSSQWELDLIKDVKNNFTFVSEILDKQIEHLKNIRNICAHPTFNHGLELYQPSAEQCKGIIRTFIEGLFLLPPLQHEAITSSLLADLADKKDIFINDEKLQKYLEAKYFSKSNKLVLEKLYKALWKIVFKLEDDECNVNRQQNLKALIFLSQKKGIAFESLIANDKGYYNKISETNEVLKYAAFYLSKFPTLLDSISDNNKLLLQEIVKDDCDLLANMKFIFPDFTEWERFYSIALNLKLEDGIDLVNLYEIPMTPEHQERFRKNVIKRYGQSTSFAEADSKFKKVHLLLKYISLEELDTLVDFIAENGQTHSRKRAKDDHKSLVSSTLERFGASSHDILRKLPEIDKFAPEIVGDEEE